MLGKREGCGGKKAGPDGGKQQVSVAVGSKKIWQTANGLLKSEAELKSNFKTRKKAGRATKECRTVTPYHGRSEPGHADRGENGEPFL